jgi:hypothetical protein
MPEGSLPVINVNVLHPSLFRNRTSAAATRGCQNGHELGDLSFPLTPLTAVAECLALTWRHNTNHRRGTLFHSDDDIFIVNALHRD